MATKSELWAEVQAACAAIDAARNDTPCHAAIAARADRFDAATAAYRAAPDDTAPAVDTTARFVAAVINNLGDGDHPMATVDNLSFFAPGYVRTCLRRARDKGGLSDAGAAALAAAIAAHGV